MTVARLVVLALSLTDASAFAAPFINSAFVPSAPSLVSITKTSLGAAAQIDYDNFEVGESKALAVKDEVVGDGDEAEEGCMMTVSFKGRTMSTNVEQNVEKFTFKLGEEGAVMEGWQQGLPGMKVGGKRCLRIPAGDLARGPPGEDLEFEVQLITVSTGAFNEFLIKNGLGANGKTYGLLGLIVLSAILPQLEKAGILGGQGLLGS